MFKKSLLLLLLYVVCCKTTDPEYKELSQDCMYVVSNLKITDVKIGVEEDRIKTNVTYSKDLSICGQEIEF
jgi:hypothetical protein